MVTDEFSGVEIYTDGSCHTQHCIGAWASILFVANEKIILSGTESNTTHNRMEILAVTTAVEYILNKYPLIKEIRLVSDSQYVIGLIDRQPKFIKSNFKTKAGNDIRNVDLVKVLLALANRISIRFVKIKAHQKENEIANYNIEVDKICRKLVRGAVNYMPLLINN
jgi:ribonuclease HI